MRVPEVFSVIHEQESNYYLRERKFTIIRAILTERLADKNDFKSVIEKHTDIVKRLNIITVMSEPEIEEALIDIYNYPVIREEYDELVKDFVFEIIKDEEGQLNDDTEIDEDDEHEPESEDDDDDDDEDEPYEETDDEDEDYEVHEQDLRRLNTKMTMTLIFSSVTFILSVVNTLALFIRR